MENPQGAPPKLDIKLNEQKMVFLKNVVTKVGVMRRCVGALVSVREVRARRWQRGGSELHQPYSGSRAEGSISTTAR